MLAAVPILVFGGLAASGHVLMEADNLIQNFPLRSLVGIDLRHGHLPLWDPYLASGTPLLGGFNAGAAYPGTWLFAFLPAQGAWAVNVIAVYEVTLFGMFVFLRRQTLSVGAATLGAAAFTFGGFMSAQFVHIDLIEGAAWLPWMLIALDGLADAAAGSGSARRERERPSPAGKTRSAAVGPISRRSWLRPTVCPSWPARPKRSSTAASSPWSTACGSCVASHQAADVPT